MALYLLAQSAGQYKQATDTGEQYSLADTFDFSVSAGAAFKKVLTITGFDGQKLIVKENTGGGDTGNLFEVQNASGVAKLEVTRDGDVTVGGDLTVQGDEVVVGNITYEGPLIQMGDEETDVVDFYASIQGNSALNYAIHPARADVDFGTTGDKFRGGYFSGLLQANQLQSTVASGTTPLIIASNTVVANLNASLLQGSAAADFAAAVHSHGKGDLPSSTVYNDQANTFTAAGTLNLAACDYHTGLILPVNAGAPSSDPSDIDGAIMVDTTNHDLWAFHGTWSKVAKEADVVLRDGTQGLSADWDAGSHKITAEQLESDIASGTAPLIVASNTVVANLNADLLDGNEASAFAAASHSHVPGDVTLNDGYLIEGNGSNVGAAVLKSSIDAADFGSGAATASYQLTADGVGGCSWQAGGAPSTHALGGASHTADTLANLNSKVTDATLTDADDQVLVDGTNPLTADWDAGSFKIKAEQIESDIASGTAPLIVASNTVVANLNASFLEGNAAADFAAAVHTHAWNDINKAGSVLGDIANVNEVGLADGNLLMYITADTAWKNVAMSSEATIASSGALTITKSITPTWTDKHVWEKSGVTPGTLVDIWEGGTATAGQNYESARLRWTASVWDGLAAEEGSIEAYIGVGPAASNEWYFRLYDPNGGVNLLEINRFGNATILGDFAAQGVSGSSLTTGTELILPNSTVSDEGHFQQYTVNAGDNVYAGQGVCFIGNSLVSGEAADVNLSSMVKTPTHIAVADKGEGETCSLAGPGDRVIVEIESTQYTGAYVAVNEILIAWTNGKMATRDKSPGLGNAIKPLILITDVSLWDPAGLNYQVEGIVLDRPAMIV